MIDKYEQPIYPFELYVAIDNDLEKILSEFIDFDGVSSSLTTDCSWKHNDAVVYYEILNKNTNSNSYLVVFPKEPDIPDIPLIAHEAFHVLFRVYEFIGETKWANEPSAYLLEWIVKCITNTITKYNDTSLENN